MGTVRLTSIPSDSRFKAWVTNNSHLILGARIEYLMLDEELMPHRPYYLDLGTKLFKETQSPETNGVLDDLRHRPPLNYKSDTNKQPPKYSTLTKGIYSIAQLYGSTLPG